MKLLIWLDDKIRWAIGLIYLMIFLGITLIPMFTVSFITQDPSAMLNLLWYGGVIPMSWILDVMPYKTKEDFILDCMS